jgi:hypothetical protein
VCVCICVCPLDFVVNAKKAPLNWVLARITVANTHPKKPFIFQHTHDGLIAVIECNHSGGARRGHPKSIAL